jgi:chromosome segregation ATPase
MKRIFTLSVLIPLGMICSCQKQDSAVERQLSQRKAELDAREQAFAERVNELEERMNELDKRVSAMAEREITNPEATASAPQSQAVIPDPAQVQAQVDSGIQQIPADAQPVISDPMQQDPEKAEKDRIREQLGLHQRGLDKESNRRRKFEQTQRWMASQAAGSPVLDATSPTPSPTPP